MKSMRPTFKLQLTVTIVGLIIVGIGTSIFLAFNTPAAAISLLYIMVVSVSVLLVLGLVLRRLEGLNADLRQMQLILNNTAGSAGRSAPLIRDIYRHVTGTELQGGALSPVPLDTTIDLESLEELTHLLSKREKLESQTLRQIAAEARLMRIYLERVGNNESDQ